MSPQSEGIVVCQIGVYFPPVYITYKYITLGKLQIHSEL